MEQQIKKWTPRPITEQYNFLDLDCVTDINKAILLRVGNISKQLIDNKITTKETSKYIDILHKYELAIINEFAGMTTEIKEQNRDK